MKRNYDCKECGAKYDGSPSGGVIRIEEYDAFACKVCNTWIKSFKCSDKNCEFCKDRPDKPFETTLVTKC